MYAWLLHILSITQFDESVPDKNRRDQNISDQKYILHFRCQFTENSMANINVNCLTSVFQNYTASCYPERVGTNFNENPKGADGEIG